jgi:hypothetical protein
MRFCVCVMKDRENFWRDSEYEHSSLRFISRCYIGIELIGLVARNGQRSPVACGFCCEVFREKNNLPDMVSIVRDLSIDRLHHGMRLSANCDGARQICFGERLERVE